jgi:hypothetical protein
MKLCYAMPCYTTLCYAILFYAMLCYAMLHYAMLCYMLHYTMLCYAICYTMLYATLCYARAKAKTNTNPILLISNACMHGKCMINLLYNAEMCLCTDMS